MSQGAAPLRGEAAPLDAHDFQQLMEPLGPFAQPPRLAVAVSGGADSMALCLLAAQWATQRGGHVLALTVDHGLRPAAAQEARRVGDWLAARRIGHRVLRWEGDKPASGIQAAARAARYGLLAEACRQAGITDLLLGHHLEDQAETFLLRLGRGSGLEGLAAMSPQRVTPWGRLLRPLLGVERQRLAATLVRMGQPWIEDPSNADPAFARVRLRRLGDLLAAEGLGPTRLAATARRLARARDALEVQLEEAAARLVRLDEAGFALVDAGGLAVLPEEVGLRLLSRLLLAQGGGAYTPRLERLERLWQEISVGLEGARTLAGCRIQPWKGGLLLCREAGRMAPPVELVAGGRLVWDGRFEVEVADAIPTGLRLGGLGPGGRAGLASLMAPQRPRPLPASVGVTLPALFDPGGILAVPHLGYNREGAGRVLSRLRALTPRLAVFSACADGNRHYV